MNRVLKVMLVTAACGGLAVGTAPAYAKGCIKGAVVGGVAGHMAGHGALGAAGGCAVGHHMANKADRNGSSQQSDQPASSRGNPNRP